MLNISVMCDWCGAIEDRICVSGRNPEGWTFAGAAGDEPQDLHDEMEADMEWAEFAVTLCPACSGHVAYVDDNLRALDDVGRERLHPDLAEALREADAFNQDDA